MFLNEAKELKAFSMGIVESENGFASILSEAILTEEEAVKSGDEAKKESNIKNFFSKVQNWLKEQLKKLKNLAGNVLRSIKENFGALKHRVTSGEWMKGSHARHKLAYFEGVAASAANTLQACKEEMLTAEALLKTNMSMNNTDREKVKAAYDKAAKKAKKASETFKEASAKADEIFKKAVDVAMAKNKEKAEKEKEASVKSSGSTNKLIAAGESMWKTVSGLVSSCIKSVTSVFSKSKATGNVETDKENRNLVLRAKEGLLSALASIGRGIASIFSLVFKPIKFLVGKVKKDGDKGQEGSNLPAVVK